MDFLQVGEIFVAGKIIGVGCVAVPLRVHDRIADLAGEQSDCFHQPRREWLVFEGGAVLHLSKGVPLHLQCSTTENL